MSSITEYFAIGMLCGISIVIGRQCEKNNQLLKDIRDVYEKLRIENDKLVSDNLAKENEIHELIVEIGKLNGKEGHDLVQFVVNYDRH